MENPQVVAILGGQWGDEGKGKVVDYAAAFFSLVARATGGNNAGHTIYIKGKKHVFHLLPSSMTWDNVDCVLGNGMVIDPFVLLSEMKSLVDKGFSTDRLYISGNAHVIMLYHRTHDGYQEKSKGDGSIGTTKRGIGPAYADKKHRTGIRMNDLLDRKMLYDKILYNVKEKLGMFTHVYNADKKEIIKEFWTSIPDNGLFNEYRESLAALDEDSDVESIAEVMTRIYHSAGKMLVSHIADSSRLIHDTISKDKKVLLEGAQGLLLDIDHGTYPFVTSSNPSVGGLKTGLGISKIDEVYSIIKAYTTRVGSGPFPTEMEDIVGQKIREKGQEYGATTGRPRRCGWHDAVLTRHTSKVNGKKIIITKLDILTGVDKIKICNSYKYTGPKRLFNGEVYFSGKILKDFPCDSTVLEHCVPEQWIEVDGWTEDISGARDMDSLPDNARKYLKKIEELGGVEIVLISVGPERDQTIEVPGRWLLRSPDSASQPATEVINADKKKYRAIIYDLDNTLLATDDFVRILMKETAQKIGKYVRFKVPADAEIAAVQKKNLPMEDMFDILFPDPEEYMQNEPFSRFVLARYRESAKDLEYWATPNGVSVFREFEDKGIVQLIVTNRMSMAKERLMQAGYPENYFIFSPENKEDRKPNPKVFKTALATLESRGIKKEEVLSIGDHTDDYLASLRAGLDFVGVLTGLTTKEDFKSAGLEGSRVIKDIVELKKIIR